MTHLLDTFVSTFLAEQGRYCRGRNWVTLADHAIADIDPVPVFVYDGPDPERWIAKKAVRKAFGALRAEVGRTNWTGPDMQSAMVLLNTLSAEPETTSGERP